MDYTKKMPDAVLGLFYSFLNNPPVFDFLDPTNWNRLRNTFPQHVLGNNAFGETFHL
jgi:hypothetical protein